MYLHFYLNIVKRPTRIAYTVIYKIDKKYTVLGTVMQRNGK